MSSFGLTRAARADLKSIARLTEARWGVRQRNAYLKEVDRIFHALARNPAMGRACDDILQGYRRLPHGAHVIYYRQIAGQEVMIVRILHGAMDAEAYLDT
ncbi:type II toxin-antitoxin system RelE/ParE family toxin [Luteimonas granuli]|uniref:Toxin n=1 Tax=Luteimonas granuli TaxID=1176533 RepID=A0A518N2E3_9GAMM|nr:type II toxin-antitoxin system RelE/ParE family toxin [Luteimonas granuli]QDW66095.1 type II toxin-antitoxin system RelE/ParE family toxin [Luteimonas granuli]